MRIAILSDIHDNIWNLEQVLKGLAGVDVLIFLGDFCAPFTLKQIADGFSGPVHCIFGNNDGDPFLLCQVAAGAPHVTLHGLRGELTLDGVHIAFVHYPELAADMAASGKYDLVLSGHDHTRKEERIGKTLWVNPGEVMGRFGHPSYAIYDTETRTVRFVAVEPSRG